MIRFLQINLTKKQVTIPGGKKSENSKINIV